MQGFMDYISSVVLGGMVFISLMSFYGQIDESHMAQVLSSVVQEECTCATEIMESDLRKVGFGVTDTVKIALPDSTGIRFAADIDGNGSVDSVSYYLSLFPVSGASNARTRVLYRRVNGQDTPVLTGVTSFRIRYYDRTGNSTLIPSAIRLFDVRLTHESDSAIDGQYSGVVWNRTFKPHNLR